MALLIGCGPSTSNPAKNTYTEASSPLRSTCYLLTKANPPYTVDTASYPSDPDSLYIHLDLLGELANGVYEWLPGGQDPVTGTFQGSLNDSLITALYTFNTEGMDGKQEVIFRLESNGLRIGSGEMTGDSISVFKDKGNLEFGELVPKVDCSMVRH
jgi:hypothetical protein